MIKWVDEPTTAYWAQRWLLPVGIDKQPQYDGANQRLQPTTWRQHIIADTFPTFCLDSSHQSLCPSPANIIGCFAQRSYLEGLALVVAWGAMTRTKNKRIYTQPLDVIEQSLRQSELLIERHHLVEPAWDLLTRRLGWTPVITSKVLHFLVRAIGEEENPPSPIDNRVILEQVWPSFIRGVRSIRQSDEPPLPEAWYDASNSWAAYNRYMTAMRYWARSKGWTTTEYESTVFQAYYPAS